MSSLPNEVPAVVPLGEVAVEAVATVETVAGSPGSSNVEATSQIDTMSATSAASAASEPGPETPATETAAEAPAAATPPIPLADRHAHYYRDQIHNKFRGYQSELFDLCCNANSLAVMPTGTGKTLLAFAIAEHRRIKVREETQMHKPALMLFVTRSLCSQQHKVCVEEFAKIGKPDGSRICNLLQHHDVLSCNNDDDDELEDYDIIFGISSHVKNYLQIGRPDKISNFSIIIFDEAHNLRGDSPGVKIMDNYVKNAPLADRPQILGLTATPFSKKTKAVVEMTELCGVLDAPLVTPTQEDNITEMLQYAAHAPPEIVIVPPTAAENGLLRYLSSALEQVLQLLNEFHESEEEVEGFTGGTRIQQVVGEIVKLGQWTSDTSRTLANYVGQKDLPLSLLSHLNLLLLDVRTLTEKAGVLSAQDHWKEQYNALQPPKVEGTTLRAQQTASIAALITDINNNMEAKFAETTPADDQYGSKEKSVLTQLIREHEVQKENMRVIVFVPLVVEAQQMAKRFDKILQDALPGSSVKVIDYTKNTSASKGKDIRSRFLKGKLKVIFSTTALEEGIDIPGCSLVIRFYMLSSSIISLNQCRGRARKSEARFALFVNNELERDQAERHLDYNVIMRLSRDHSQEIALSTRMARACYNDKVNAESLVHFYCTEMVETGYADALPCINMFVSDDGLRTLTLCIPVSGEPEGRVFSVELYQNEINTKFKLLKDICKFLESIGCLKPLTAHSHASFEMREYESQTAGSGKVDADMQAYDRATWNYCDLPYDKLVELCRMTHTVHYQLSQEGDLHSVSLAVTANRGGKRVFGGKEKDRVGYPDSDTAVQNAALSALRAVFKFNFFTEDAPKEIQYKVPKRAEQRGLALVSRYNHYEGRSEQLFVPLGKAASVNYHGSEKVIVYDPPPPPPPPPPPSELMQSPYQTVPPPPRPSPYQQYPASSPSPSPVRAGVDVGAVVPEAEGAHAARNSSARDSVSPANANAAKLPEQDAGAPKQAVSQPPYQQPPVPAPETSAPPPIPSPYQQHPVPAPSRVVPEAAGTGASPALPAQPTPSPYQRHPVPAKVVPVSVETSAPVPSSSPYQQHPAPTPARVVSAVGTSASPLLPAQTTPSSYQQRPVPAPATVIPEVVRQGASPAQPPAPSPYQQYTTPANVVTAPTGTSVPPPTPSHQQYPLPAPSRVVPEAAGTGASLALPAQPTPSPYQQHSVPAPVASAPVPSSSPYQQHPVPIPGTSVPVPTSSPYQQHSAPTPARVVPAAGTGASPALPAHPTPSPYQQRPVPAPVTSAPVPSSSPYQQHPVPTPGTSVPAPPPYQQHPVPAPAAVIPEVVRQGASPAQPPAPSPYQQYTTPANVVTAPTGTSVPPPTPSPHQQYPVPAVPVQPSAPVPSSSPYQQHPVPTPARVMPTAGKSTGLVLPAPCQQYPLPTRVVPGAVGAGAGMQQVWVAPLMPWVPPPHQQFPAAATPGQGGYAVYNPYPRV